LAFVWLCSHNFVKSHQTNSGAPHEKMSNNRKYAGLKRPKSSMRKLYERILIGGFALMLLCASPSRVHAEFVDGIEMVSQSYHISAQWHGIHDDFSGPDPVETNYAGGYDVSTSDGTPVTASAAAPFNVMTANASIDRFSFQDYSSCPYHGGDGFLNGSAIIQTQAQGLWDFQTAGSSLTESMQ